MPVALAVVAVIAANAGFDDTGVVDVDDVHEDRVTGMVDCRRDCSGVADEPARFGLGRCAGRTGAEMSRDSITDQGAKLELVHGVSFNVTRSTMPMIAASTGAALRRSASPAARPSITISTRSPTPAPTESMVRSGVPRG